MRVCSEVPPEVPPPTAQQSFAVGQATDPSDAFSTGGDAATFQTPFEYCSMSVSWDVSPRPNEVPTAQQDPAVGHEIPVSYPPPVSGGPGTIAHEPPEYCSSTGATL